MGAGQNVSVLADDYAAARSAGNLRAEPEGVHNHFFLAADSTVGLMAFARGYAALRTRYINFLDHGLFFFPHVCKIGTEIAAGQRDYSGSQKCQEYRVRFFLGRLNGAPILYLESVCYIHPFQYFQQIDSKRGTSRPRTSSSRLSHEYTH